MAELRGLREQEERQQAFLNRILARPQTQANVELAERAAENLERTRNAIQTILDGQAADAEAARSDARQARDRADDALLDILGGAGAAGQGQAAAGAGNGGLCATTSGSPINCGLLLRHQIEQVRARVKDRARANDIIAGLVTELIQLNNQRKDLQAQLAEQQREAQEARLERVERGIELDIELADINENTKRRVALRLQLIAQLKKEARVLKLHGNALRENRNERARIRKEIEDLLENVEGGPEPWCPVELPDFAAGARLRRQRHVQPHPGSRCRRDGGRDDRGTGRAELGGKRSFAAGRDIGPYPRAGERDERDPS